MSLHQPPGTERVVSTHALNERRGLHVEPKKPLFFTGCLETTWSLESNIDSDMSSLCDLFGNLCGPSELWFSPGKMGKIKMSLPHRVLLRPRDNEALEFRALHTSVSYACPHLPAPPRDVPSLGQ